VPLVHDNETFIEADLEGAWMDECEEHTYHIQEPFVCPEWSVKPHAASPQNISLDSLVWPPGGKQIKPIF